MPFRICPRRVDNRIEICTCGDAEMQVCLSDAVSDYLNMLREAVVDPDPNPFMRVALDITCDALSDAFDTYDTLDDALREIEE